MRAKLEELKVKQQSLEEAWMAITAARNKEILSEGMKGHYVQLMPGYAAKAIKIRPGSK